MGTLHHPPQQNNSKKHHPSNSESEEIEEIETSNVTKKPLPLKFILGLIVILILSSIIIGVIFLFLQKSTNTPNSIEHQLTEVEGTPTWFYDNLTGQPISHSGTQYDASGNPILDNNNQPQKFSIKQAEQVANEINSQPTFCIQIPNGMDGARPQTGLNQASVVFEAIAEAGITRFAAIFKNPINQTAIGPIRSLRVYHLDWVTPFDCTIIHAGGADDALSAVSTGYKHLSESFTYMWRSTGTWTRSGFIGYYAPNNLLTSGSLLADFHRQKENDQRSYPKSFARLTPEESLTQKQSVEKSTEQTEQNQSTDSTYKKVSNIHIHFNWQAGFNVDYLYNPNTNTYLRSFQNGEKHLSYTCENTKNKPTPALDCSTPVQIAPEVVVVMRVKQHTSPLDHYHEDITTIGSGPAYIFQNGTVLEGTWHKSSRESQFIFKNQQGEEIKLKPGRTWLSAIPESYGEITYD